MPGIEMTDRNRLFRRQMLDILLALLLAISLALVTVDTAQAQKRVPAGNDSAGFSFSTGSVNAAGRLVSPGEPIISYRLDIAMLAGIDDRPTITVYGDGRVTVHYPVYMKKAGDYEMQLEEDELVSLVQSFSANGVLDFDGKKVKQKIREKRDQRRAKGQLYAISDSTETIIDVRLDEYQKDRSAKAVKRFHKRFRWTDIEHDARRYPQQREIVDANRSVQRLRGLMKDHRLVRRR